MEREVYIDGDILPYRIGFATQRTIYRLDSWGQHSAPVLITRSKARITKMMDNNPDLVLTEAFFVEGAANVLATLQLSLNSIVKGSKCKKFKVVLSGKDNFRVGVATIQEYKGNRKGTDKPHHWQLIRDWLEAKPYSIVTENEEADDVISRALVAGHVCATIDKDLNNTAGTHYNFAKDKLYEVSEVEADRNFYKQMLTGDDADHIPGIRGIGAKTAEKMIGHLRKPEDMEQVVYEKYAKVYDDPIKAMTEVGQLLWMRREVDEMWSPQYV